MGIAVGLLHAYAGLTVAIVALIVVWAAASGTLHYLGQEARADILNAIAGALRLRYTELSTTVFPETKGEPTALLRCADVGLFPPARGCCGFDLFEGRRADCLFTIYNAEMVDADSKPVFRGLAIWIDYPDDFDGVTLVTRDAGAFNALRKRPDQMQRISLGEPRFEQTFEVFGTDQVEARMLLHPALLEKLVEAERLVRGQDLRCAFIDGSLMVFMRGRWRFRIGNLFSTFRRYERVEAIARELTVAMSLVDTVLAGPPHPYQTEIDAARAKLPPKARRRRNKPAGS